MNFTVLLCLEYNNSNTHFLAFSCIEEHGSSIFRTCLSFVSQYCLDLRPSASCIHVEEYYYCWYTKYTPQSAPGYLGVAVDNFEMWCYPLLVVSTLLMYSLSHIYTYLIDNPFVVTVLQLTEN